MKFIRVVSLYLGQSLEEQISFRVQIGDVTVETIPIGKASVVENKTRVLLKAGTRLDGLPNRTQDGIVDVPENARRMCEAAIEHTANTIAVISCASRSISSLRPSAAFIAESEEERKFLLNCDGVRATPQSRPEVRYHLELCQKWFDGLADRQNGVALLAESMSHRNAMAKYRDYLRFLELAFALPINQIEKKLAQFLIGADLGYSRSEVGQWIALRDGAIHGDQTDYSDDRGRRFRFIADTDSRGWRTVCRSVATRVGCSP